MKKSINYWAFPGGLEGVKDIAAVFKEARQAGFEAVELAIGETGKLSLKSTEKQCERIRRQAERAGVEIASVASGIYWRYNLGCTKVTDRNRSERATKKMLQIANWLGTDALLFIPGAVDIFFDPGVEVVPYDVVYARARQGIKRLLRTAEKYNVALCIENVWNKFLLSPLEMRDFIDGFDSEYVGVYFDVGNTLLLGYPEHWIRILGKRIKRVHFKDFKRAIGTAEGFCDLLEGDVNWSEVIKALGAVGYQGYCTAETIPPYREHPQIRMHNTSAAMDAILGRA